VLTPGGPVVADVGIGLPGQASCTGFVELCGAPWPEAPRLAVLLRKVGFIDLYSAPLSGGIAALYEGHKPD
jgi:hypothetical protein